MIEGVPTDPRGHLDIGADRDIRVVPCRLRTWCKRADGHTDQCLEAPRTEHPPEDFGPEASKRRRY